MEFIKVTAAIIKRGNSVLVARRKSDGTPRSGKWEFPGGKVEKGESLQQCLQRELTEELCIDAVIGDTVTEVKHIYPDRKIHLIALEVISYSGEMVLTSHSEIAWVDIADLQHVDFSCADVPIAEYLIKNA